MNTQSSVSLTTIGQVSVNVHDLDRATAFYKDVLGMKHLFSVPPRMAFFDCDGVRLMLAIPERPDLDHPSSILYFKVQDIEETYLSLGKEYISKVNQCLLRPWQPTICGWWNFGIQKITFSL